MTFPLRAQALSAVTTLGVLLIGVGAFLFMPQLRGPGPEDFLLEQNVEVFVSHITSVERAKLSSLIPLLSSVEAHPEQTVVFVSPNSNTLGSITFTPNASADIGFDVQAEPATLTSLLGTSGATLGKNEYFTRMKHAAGDAAFIYVSNPAEVLTLPSPLKTSITSPLAISSSGSEIDIFWPHNTNNQKRDTSFAYEIPVLKDEVLRIESTNIFAFMQKIGTHMESGKRLGAIGLLQQRMLNTFGPELEPQVSLLSLLNTAGTVTVRSQSGIKLMLAGTQENAGAHLDILRHAAATDTVSIATIDRLFDDEFAFKALEAETGSGIVKETINGWSISTVRRGNGEAFVTAERDHLFVMGTDEDGIKTIVEETGRMPALKDHTERGHVHFSLLQPYQEWIDVSAIRALFPQKEAIEWDLNDGGRLGMLRIR